MMKRFMLLMIMYYFYEIVIYGIIPMISQDYMFNSYATILHQFYDFTINIALLWIFRPRTWPPYFHIGIYDGILNELNEEEDFAEL